MYVAGFVIPVPEAKRDAYRAWAAESARFFRDCGCLEIVDAWEDEVPGDGRTGFRRAVAAEPGERIVFAWQIWPDRATMQAAEARLRDLPAADPPFDARRLILGCFVPLLVAGPGPHDAACTDGTAG